MDKKKLAQAFISYLEEQLMAAKEVARATHEGVTNEESKPENEYDTRALEASYLAGAQAKRAAEIDEVLSLFQHISIKDFSGLDPISATALVLAESDKKKNYFFLMPKGGGFKLVFEGHPVQILTPSSQLGEALLGRRQGDEIEVEIGDHVKVYEVLRVV